MVTKKGIIVIIIERIIITIIITNTTTVTTTILMCFTVTYIVYVVECVTQLHCLALLMLLFVSCTTLALHYMFYI